MKLNEGFQEEGEGEDWTVAGEVVVALLMAVEGEVILVTDSTCSPLAKPA